MAQPAKEAGLTEDTPNVVLFRWGILRNLVAHTPHPTPKTIFVYMEMT